MVGLSDIPFVGKTIDRISDATVEAVFRKLKYMISYRALIGDLISEIEKVNTEEASVSAAADAARADGKIIYADLFKWQLEVAEIQASYNELVETYENRSSCLPIPNPVSRFRLGREAVVKARRVSELTALGKDLLAREIAFRPPYHDFESRKDPYDKLWEGLVNQESPLIHAIYGAPGVGITEMTRKIQQEVLKQNIFDKVAFAIVGRDRLDIINLQNQIADHLGCHFESRDDVGHRASQLSGCLLNSGRILVIFHDVWTRIQFDVIGIPWDDGSSSMGCKILLTSRNPSVCLLNNCRDPTQIRPLTMIEAWDLFKNTVGISDFGVYKNLAMKVCKKCEGHPLIISALGKALRCKPLDSWGDTLLQLDCGEIGFSLEMEPIIYSCFNLIIDELPDDAKSCLLLCSLFPDNAEIHIGKLIQLATASQLVLDGESRVCTMVDELSSSMLLDYTDFHEIKMHRPVRDWARSIAIKDPKYAFQFARCGPGLPDHCDYGTRKFLFIDMQIDDVYFPDDLVCPNLLNLWLQCNKHRQRFSSGFFSMFRNLRFLLIHEGMFSSLEPQFSLRHLGNLSTLILDCCDMTDIDQTHINFFPQSLQTLCIWNCDLPVPLDLPNLSYLRKLEIDSRCPVIIVPNFISRLSRLEVLHIRNGLQFQDGSPATAPSSFEISKLKYLKSLKMPFRVSDPVQDKNVLGDLDEFEICVGEPGEGTHYLLNSSVSVKRRIELYSNQLEAFTNLIERAEDVKLLCNDIDVSSIFSNNRQAFGDLRNLYNEECNTIDFQARISGDKIQHSHQCQRSFCKLTTIQIYGCSSMTYLFSNSIANCFMQLRELCIENCPKIEAIVRDEGTSDEGDIIFYRLKLLKLVGLPKLTNFHEHNDVQFHLLFDEKVAFPSLEELHIEDLEDTKDIWAKHDYKNVKSFSHLKSLKVSECNNLKIVIPPAMFPRLQNLESLSIGCCDSVISEVGTFGSNAEVYPLEALRALDLESLPCLTETKLNSRENSEGKTWYPNLEILRICDCNSLRNVFLSTTARDLMQLKKLRVVNCKKMTEIIGVGKRDITAGIILREMTDLQLTRLPNLTSIWGYQSEEPEQYKVEFPKLVNFKFLNCAKLTWIR
ncbi:hypothetical protein ACET3Z_011502 [Daucus carota]